MLVFIIPYENAAKYLILDVKLIWKEQIRKETNWALGTGNCINSLEKFYNGQYTIKL